MTIVLKSLLNYQRNQNIGSEISQRITLKKTPLLQVVIRHIQLLLKCLIQA